jgi:diguanylate cyclase (GGDEF)-like protein
VAVLSRAVGRAGILAFRPAVAFTRRLRYAQKFMVVGLVLIVPLVTVVLVYVGAQRKGERDTARERHGVEFIGPLTVLTTHLVSARHEVVLSVGESRPDLGADLARIDTLDRRVGGVLGTSGDWQRLRGTIVAAGQAQGGVLARVKTYDAAAKALLAFIARVGDQSGLTLDPDLDSYYLIQLVQNELPLLLDTVGRVTDRASFADPRSLTADADAFIELGVYNGVLSTAHDAVARATRIVAETTADDAVRQVILGHFARLDAVTAAFDHQLQTAVGNRRVGVALVNGADSVRSEATYFATDAAIALDQLLQARIERLSTRVRWVQLGAGLATALAIYLFIGFYLSVAAPIRRIVAVLHAVADGDLTGRVVVDTHDELSFVGRALNDTIAKTEAVTNRLARQASHDTLTGLPNRAFVLDRLDEALERTRQAAAAPMAVLFIDLDKFKIINDTLGHAAGDTVLRTVAGRLTRAVRPNDLVARLAGDEFVVIAEGLGPGDAVAVAERVVVEVSQPITIRTQQGDRDVNVGGSVGIAFADGNRIPSPDDLLRDADVAMYQAKEHGRGRVELFDDEMYEAVAARLAVHQGLRQAIDAGDVQVHYQPIIDTDSGRVVCFEALVRWERSDHGPTDARELVALAEEAGLIGALGSHVLTEACRQVVHWRTTRAGCEQLRVAVNVSGRQFGEPGFVQAVAAALADSGLDPDALWLEITESSIMADTDATRATVSAIRALGVNLAIDDFGTGYSSLAYLRRFPVQVIKIDGSFTVELGHDPQADAIVTMIVGLAQALQLSVVAEGVESADQLARLRAIGCRFAQGLHLGGPASADRVWAELDAATHRSTVALQAG